MKKTLLTIAMGCCSLLLMPAGKLYAQLQPGIFNPPVLPDKPLAPTPYGMATLSTAMIECPTVGSTITAIAHSDFEKTYLYVELGDGISTVGPILVADARWGAVDVALADDPVFPGYIYRVAVTYRNTNLTNNTYDLWIKQYEIKLEPNVPAISVQLQERVLLATVPIGHSNLRIDAVPTSTGATVGNGAAPLIDRFLVMYSDINDNLKVRLAKSNDLTNPSINFVPYPGYAGKDIAASINLNNNEVLANIATRPLGPAPSNLAYLEVNMTTGVSGVPNPLFPGNAYDPRIEAFGHYKPGAGYAKWTIVARENLQKIMLYTDMNPGYHCNTSQYNPGNGTTQESPNVAAGIGPVWAPGAGYTGNRQYSYAWGDHNKGRYLAQALDVSGAPINPNQASIVNNAYCTMLSDPSDIISVSNSCNTGSGTVVAWNEGNKIFYKYLGNGYQFKPTGIENAGSAPVTEIYPNPAIDHFKISTANFADQFNIKVTASDGKTVLTQQGAGRTATIDISGFVPGMYFVEVSDGVNKSVQRLVKQ